MYNKNANAKLKWYLILLLWFVGGFCSPAWASNVQGSYELPRIADGLSITPHFFVWEDPTANAKFMEAQKVYERGRFQPLARGFASYGFTSSAYWFRAALSNPQVKARNLVFSVPLPLLDSVDVYCQLNEGRTYYYPLGEQIDFERRQLKVRHYAIPLTLPPVSRINCYFRVETTSNLAMELQVSDVDIFLAKESNGQWMSGLFYGVALSFLIAVLVLYVVMRDPLYLYYTVHIIGGLGYSSSADGTLSALWSFLGVENFASVFFIVCWMIGALLFAIEFLEIKRRYRDLYRAMLGVIASLLLMLLSYPLLPELQSTKSIIYMVTVYTFFLLGVGGFCAYREHSKENRKALRRANCFVIGWGGICVTVALALLAVSGVVQDEGLTTTGIKFGWAYGVVIFGGALGIGLRLMKRREQDFQKGMVTAQDENSEKSNFLAKMSHEIRTPMSGILGLAELLETTPLSKVQQRYLKAIQDSGKSMMSVVNGVLDFSKIEAGKVSLKNVPIDVKGLLIDCLTVFEMSARKKQLPLFLTIEAGTPLTVMGDPERIRQVIINLLSNALKFTTVGRVSLSITMTDQILDEHLVLRIEIKDTGIGIGEEDKARLFQPFSQIENGRLINDEGTGLGLMICRQIVGLMSGDIGVHSESGKGSVFWFTVPFEVPEDCVLSDEEEIIELLEYREFNDSALDEVLNETLHFNAESDAVSGSIDASDLQEPNLLPLGSNTASNIISNAASSARILVVEDNEINCKVIWGYLERMGVIPDIVTNGQQALDKFQKEGKRYDLVLMDCEMPILDGFSATLALHQWQDGLGIDRTPVVALSAHATQKHIQRSREVGMLMHVAKPLSYQRFSEAVREALGSDVI